MAVRQRSFSAVFPPSADVLVPTPTATPVLGSTGFSDSFGGPVASDAGAESSGAEQIRWDRAWHTATAYLSLPDKPITAAQATQDDASLRAQWIKPFTAEVANAVSYLLSEDSFGRQLRRHSTRDNLLEWYYEEIGSRHYVDYVRPGLLKVIDTILLSLFRLIEHSSLMMVRTTMLSLKSFRLYKSHRAYISIR